MGNDEYFNNDEFREMLNDYETAVSSGQMVFMDADDLVDIADYYQLHERYEDAQRAIDRAIELDPNSIFALSYKVHEALTCNNYKAAEDYLAKMDNEQHPEYICCRAEIWIAQGMTDEADQYLRKCLKDIPEEEYQDYVLDAVNLWTDYNNSEKAMEWMLRAYPEDTEDFKELMGRTYLGLGSYKDAERIFNELIDKNPFQKRYWNALANAQYMQDNYEAALTSIEYAIAIDPEDSDNILVKANALFRLDDFEEALKYYERYSEKENDELSYLYQGSCLLNLKRYEEAKTQLQKAEETALSDSPYLVDIYQELGFAYSNLKMPETALRYIDKTETLDCDHTDMLVVRGHILLSNGRIEEACAAFRKAVKDSGFSSQTLLRTIVSTYDNHYLESAYKMFLKYFDIVENNCVDGYSYMALCCYDLLRYDEYLNYLQEACLRNPLEAKQVLGHLFPEIHPKEYYEYAKRQLKL